MIVLLDALFSPKQKKSDKIQALLILEQCGNALYMSLFIWLLVKFLIKSIP